MSSPAMTKEGRWAYVIPRLSKRSLAVCRELMTKTDCPQARMNVKSPGATKKMSKLLYFFTTTMNDSPYFSFHDLRALKLIEAGISNKLPMIHFAGGPGGYGRDSGFVFLFFMICLTVHQETMQTQKRVIEISRIVETTTRDAS